MSKPDPTELLTCPFCGSDAAKITHDHGTYEPGCTHCGTYIGQYSSERSARAAWNRRAVPALVQPEPTAEPLLSDEDRELLDSVEHALNREWNGLAIHRFQRLREKLEAASPSASQPEPIQQAQPRKAPSAEVWGVVHRDTGYVDKVGEYEEDVNYTLTSGYEKRKGIAYFPASASLTPPAPEASDACPKGWVTEAFEAIWTARPGAKITDDMKRAAAIALRLARGERWDDSKQDWTAAPVPSPEPREPTPPSLPETVMDAQWMAEAERLPERIGRMAEWLNSNAHIDQTAPDEAPGPVSQFDYELTQGAQELWTIQQQVAEVLAHIGKRPAMSEDAKDAARYRWLTADHSDPAKREKCRELLYRMPVMSYAAASHAIDTAMQEASDQ